MVGGWPEQREQISTFFLYFNIAYFVTFFYFVVFTISCFAIFFGDISLFVALHLW